MIGLSHMHFLPCEGLVRSGGRLVQSGWLVFRTYPGPFVILPSLYDGYRPTLGDFSLLHRKLASIRNRYEIDSRCTVDTGAFSILD